MLRRSVRVGSQLRAVGAGGEAVRRSSGPTRPSSTRRGPDLRQLDGDRRLTLVLGLLPRTDNVTGMVDLESVASRRAHVHRTIAVNMKLKDASLSAIEAAQVLADTCFCQSHEAAVLDRILSVIDQLDDAIGALHQRPDRSSVAGPMLHDSASSRAAFRRIFVPVGRSSIFPTVITPEGADLERGGQR